MKGHLRLHSLGSPIDHINEGSKLQATVSKARKAGIQRQSSLLFLKISTAEHLSSFESPPSLHGNVNNPPDRRLQRNWKGIVGFLKVMWKCPGFVGRYASKHSQDHFFYIEGAHVIIQLRGNHTAIFESCFIREEQTSDEKIIRVNPSLQIHSRSVHVNGHIRIAPVTDGTRKVANHKCPFFPWKRLQGHCL